MRPESEAVPRHERADRGRFVAARAFVALGQSVTVVVTCDGADVNAAAQEVLSKNVIVIETAAP